MSLMSDELTLQLGGNPLTMTGVLDILESVDNSSSVISYIGFDVSSQVIFSRPYHCTQYDWLLAWYCHLSVCLSV